jgi:hypothetical protein
MYNYPASNLSFYSVGKMILSSKDWQAWQGCVIFIFIICGHGGAEKQNSHGQELRGKDEENSN